MFYSKLTNGFYSVEVNGDSVPQDSVEITSEQHAQLLAGQAVGLVITADVSGIPLLVQPPPAVIKEVTPRQIRIALTRAGLRASVEVSIAAGSQDLKDWYEFSTTFQRDQPLVIQMGIDLGQSPEQLDALWQLAASL